MKITENVTYSMSGAMSDIFKEFNFKREDVLILYTHDKGIIKGRLIKVEDGKLYLDTSKMYMSSETRVRVDNIYDMELE